MMSLMKRFVVTAGLVALLASCAASEQPADEVNGRFIEEPGFSPMPEFRTDFSRSLVPAEEIVAGGPAKDGIPAIDAPRHESVSEAHAWIPDSELVFTVTVGDETHIYPVQILMWHEIANDVVNGLPVTVTYCPLCNTGVAFDRRLPDAAAAAEDEPRVLDFGTTGRVRYSNLVMYDRQSETWWQQATGRAIVGALAGSVLTQVPMLTVPWEFAAERFPEARVLSRDTGYDRPYGRNPYAGYDRAAQPFLYSGPPTPADHNPMTRVLHVSVADQVAFYPYPRLREERVITDEVAGRRIVVFWQSGTASALDASSVAAGRDVGSANAFFAEADGRALQFTYDGGIVDQETGSRWDLSGRAVSGELAGRELEPVNAIQHFYFSWAAFERAE